MEEHFPSGFWTLYYHPSREKRWSIDSFEKIGIVETPTDVLSIFKELGEKIKGGMYVFLDAWINTPIMGKFPKYSWRKL